MSWRSARTVKFFIKMAEVCHLTWTFLLVYQLLQNIAAWGNRSPQRSTRHCIMWVRFPFFFQLHLHLWTWLKFVKSSLFKTNLINQTYDCTIFIFCRLLCPPKDPCFLSSVFHTDNARSICCSTDHAFCEKMSPIFPFLDSVHFFSPRVIHSARPTSCSFPSFMNLATLI